MIAKDGLLLYRGVEHLRCSRGIENAICVAFLSAQHQLYVVHFKRKVLNTVALQDKEKMNKELKAFFPIENPTLSPLDVMRIYIPLLNAGGEHYPSLARLGQARHAAYFTYLRFPERTRRVLYSTN